MDLLEETFNEFPQFEVGEYILRQLVEDDAEAIFEIFSDVEVMKYYGFPKMSSIDEAKSLINNMMKGYNNKKAIRWGIAKKDDNLIIGTCGYHTWDRYSSKAQIGYELNKANWKQGIMKNVLKVIIPFGFHNLQLNRIEAIIEPDNISSIKLVEKFGFEKEGILKEFSFRPAKKGFADMVMYSLLKRNCFVKKF